MSFSSFLVSFKLSNFMCLIGPFQNDLVSCVEVSIFFLFGVCLRNLWWVLISKKVYRKWDPDYNGVTFQPPGRKLILTYNVCDELSLLCHWTSIFPFKSIFLDPLWSTKMKSNKDVFFYRHMSSCQKYTDVQLLFFNIPRAVRRKIIYK